MLEHNLARLRGRMDAAARTVGRDPQDIRLMAVSKTRTVDEIRSLLRLGHRLFGENRAQEAAQKFPALKVEYPDLMLHLIGPLQTNKVQQSVALFDAIQSIDRIKLAEKIANECQKQNRFPRLFVQVNIGKETQKSGVDPENAADFVQKCCTIFGRPPDGLMAIPPEGESPSFFFRRMRELALQTGVRELSLGMSGDFEEAIREGSTLVRVGTALFGARKKT